MSDTHDVFNQSKPLLDYNLFSDDLALRSAVIREGAGWAESDLTGFGALTGSADVIELGRLANGTPPVLKAFDRSGHRINDVEYHPSYHQLMSISMAHGLHSQWWTDGQPGGLVARCAKNYMMTQVEPGHGCPITMTFAAVPALRCSETHFATWEPLITSREYDPRNIPGHEKSACTVGMAMTEKQGGSDVRANTTRAFEQGDGTFRLVGHKWFCSAPMSDLFLTLAHDDVGLSCFLVPRWTPDGKANYMDLQRLKDKLGNQSNASSEIEYNQAYAERIGEPGRGVRTILEMVTHTRLDCVVASAALMRQCLSQAVHHSQQRHTFGKRLVEHSLMQNVLADITVEVEAATMLGFRLARAYEEGRDDARQAGFARIATAIGKYWICKRAPAVAYEAMECFGGNGYVEAHPMARLYREAPLNSIWEGSGNVICLDVLRAMKREPEAFATLQSELSSVTGQDPRYDALLKRITTTMSDLRSVEMHARRLVEDLALALQASLLIRDGDPAITEAFIDSRLTSERRACFGTLSSAINAGQLLTRANPHG